LLRRPQVKIYVPEDNLSILKGFSLGISIHCQLEYHLGGFVHSAAQFLATGKFGWYRIVRGFFVAPNACLGRALDVKIWLLMYFP